MSDTKNSYKVIGLMSGTSLDGLDLAYCHFEKKTENWTFSILETEHIAYNVAFKKQLKKSVTLDAIELLNFNNRYGTWLGEQVKTFSKKNNLNVDFVSSHGHTVFHQPEIGLTYQVGSGQHLANACGYKTICDFRINDVALGGQGAPLVPIGDKFLFGTYDFCLNLGGIGNISYENKGQRIAYDISPVNMLLNYICKKIDLDYDQGGNLAKKGRLNDSLLKKLNAVDFYSQTHPKSLGYEWFVKEIIPLIETTKDSIENLLHTSVYHIAEQISIQLLATKKKNTSVLVSGGGAKNKFLIDILQSKLFHDCAIEVPDEIIIDYKEALIFAFLGILRDRNEVNCLHSVTGAKKDSSSGIIFFPS